MTFDDYFVDFMSEHTRAGTRWCHFVSLHLGVIVGVSGLLRRRPLRVAAAALGAMAADVGSHYAFEGGYPGKSLDHPLWSVRANVVMAAHLWRGRADELDRVTAGDRIAA